MEKETWREIYFPLPVVTKADIESFNGVFLNCYLAKHAVKEEKYLLQSVSRASNTRKIDFCGQEMSYKEGLELCSGRHFGLLLVKT